jgi:hypothetical protein
MQASTCLKSVKIAAISEILQVGAPCSGSIVQTRSAHKSRIPSNHIEVADMCSTPGPGGIKIVHPGGTYFQAVLEEEAAAAT